MRLSTLHFLDVMIRRIIICHSNVQNKTISEQKYILLPVMYQTIYWELKEIIFYCVYYDTQK